MNRALHVSLSSWLCGLFATAALGCGTRNAPSISASVDAASAPTGAERPDVRTDGMGATRDGSSDGEDAPVRPQDSGQSERDAPAPSQDTAVEATPDREEPDKPVDPMGGPSPIFPGAEGFGSQGRGGRGGRVLRVTNLDNDGLGSLRWALSQRVPRVIVFEVAGAITLADDLNVIYPYVTIAGQTAPSPGITLRGAGLVIKTHDVLLQHLRIRVGDLPEGPGYGNRDAMGVILSQNPATTDDEKHIRGVVIDHVSLSWSIDELLSFWSFGQADRVHDIGISDSFLTEPLENPALHPQNERHSYALLATEVPNVTVARNLFAHTRRRNPQLNNGCTGHVINNVVYNSIKEAFHVHVSDNTHELPQHSVAFSVVGNVMIPGPNTESMVYLRVNGVLPGSRIYMNDNSAPVLFENNAPFDPRVETAPIPLEGLSVLPSGQVLDRVLRCSGARPADRDAVDLRVVESVRRKNGMVVVSQQDVGGWPALTPSTRPITQDLEAMSNAMSPSGFTELDLWLDRQAALVDCRAL